MCKDFWQKSGFFGKVLFLRKPKVRIFRKSPVFRKSKSPDFQEKCHFFKNSKLRISEKTESSGSFKWTFSLLQTLAYTERLKKPSIKVKKYKKCASARKILKSSMSAKPYVRIFRTSPVWQEHKSPDFLVKPCLAKTQKSGFFGVRILSKPLYIQKHSGTIVKNG